MDNYPSCNVNELYLHGNPVLTDVLDEISLHFPGVDLSDLSISAEYIRAKCGGYDLYDCYIVIRRKEFVNEN